jgi:hypothetical protein
LTERWSGFAAPLNVMALSWGMSRQAARMASTASSRLETCRVMPVSSTAKLKAPACRVRPARSVGSELMK